MKYLTTILAVLFSSNAYCCKCKEGSLDYDAALSEASTVAFVRVCEARIESQIHKAYVLNNKTSEWQREEDTESVVVATGYTTEVFKGEDIEKVTFNAGNANSSCHVPVSVGRIYLAFINSQGVADIGVCSPTTEPHNVKMEFIRKITQDESIKSKRKDVVDCPH